MKVKEVIQALEDDGWYQARTKGSHRQFKHPTKVGTVTVSGKPSVDVPAEDAQQHSEASGFEVIAR